MALDVTGLAGLILSGNVVSRVFCAGAEQAVNSAMHALAKKTYEFWCHGCGFRGKKLSLGGPSGQGT